MLTNLKESELCVFYIRNVYLLKWETVSFPLYKFCKIIKNKQVKLCTVTWLLIITTLHYIKHYLISDLKLELFVCLWVNVNMYININAVKCKNTLLFDRWT